MGGKKRFEIRLVVSAESGSIEESVLNYLNNEKARAFSKTQTIVAALKQYWLIDALLEENQPIERVLSALEDSKFLWSIQEQRLQERIKRKYSTQAHLINVTEQLQRASFESTDSQNLTETLSPEPLLLEQTKLHPNDSSYNSDLDEAVTETTFNPFGSSITSRN